MNAAPLSQRQSREKEYYEQYSRTVKIPDHLYPPALRRGWKPWNPFHFVHEIAARHFRHSGQNLLDIGCGPGIESVRLALIGYNVHGIDLSPSNVETAKSLAQKYGLERSTRFSVQLAEKTDYPAEFFDIIVGTNILHHVDIRGTMRECARVLKKDGIAVFLEPVRVPVFDRLRASRLGLWLRPAGKSLERHITEDERKLDDNDIQIMQEIFPQLSARRFGFLSRLSQLWKEHKAFGYILDVLERIDHGLFRLLPFTQRYTCHRVFQLRK